MNRKLWHCTNTALQYIAFDAAYCNTCRVVCLLVTRVNPAKIWTDWYVLIADMGGASRAPSDSVPQQNTVQLDFVQPNAPIRDSRVQFAERCSSANYRNEFLIGAVRRTAPITMRDGQQPTGSGVLGGGKRGYTAYTNLPFFWQRILTSVIINKQGTFRLFATPVCVYPPTLLAIHHCLQVMFAACSLKR